MPPPEYPSSANGHPPSPAVLLTDNLEKPSLDDRLYRVVRLDNGLEALLVHDPETDKASAALDVNVGNFSDEDWMPGMAHAVEHVSHLRPNLATFNLFFFFFRNHLARSATLSTCLLAAPHSDVFISLPSPLSLSSRDAVVC
jgi:hypothetical protein